MQETKVTLIYFGLSLFVLLALIPWVVDSNLGDQSIQILVIYGGIIVAFLGGMIWGWDEVNTSSKKLWIAIGFSILGLVISLIALINLTLSLILLIISLQAFLSFEKKYSVFFKANNKYAAARGLITNLVTICCITSLAFLYNPYT